LFARGHRIGADAGFRLPGQALGLGKGSVDFQANVIRVHDNWVHNAPDATETSDSEAIPMTPAWREPSGRSWTATT
jgi:hypothetical protein